MTKEREEEFEVAMAFWKDAVRQFWQAIADPKSTSAQLKGYEEYYLKASAHLRSFDQD